MNAVRRPTRSRRRPGGLAGERGAASVEFAAIAALGLVVFVLLVNLVVLTYARGTVRAALDEAARTGARDPVSLAACTDRADSVLDGLFGRRLRDGVVITCDRTRDATRVVARADVRWEMWFPMLPAFVTTLRGSAAAEEPR